MPDLSIQETKDGSFTLFSEQYNATYHSIFGAIEESIHVFISAGMYRMVRLGYTNIKIFEMGFGTGLNAYLTCLEAKKYGVHVEYCSIEKHPIELNLANQMSSSLEQPALFNKIHSVNWGKETPISPKFTLLKVQDDINQYPIPNGVDIVYFDAFAPSCQSILWEKPLHLKFYNALAKNGCLVTYCAQGKFKRMLRKLGYQIERLNGPNRKHEMTRAIKVK